MLGCQLGARAVDLLLEGKSGLMVGTRDNRLVDVPLDVVLEQTHQLPISLFELAQSLAI